MGGPVYSSTCPGPGVSIFFLRVLLLHEKGPILIPHELKPRSVKLSLIGPIFWLLRNLNFISHHASGRQERSRFLGSCAQTCHLRRALAVAFPAGQFGWVIQQLRATLAGRLGKFVVAFASRAQRIHAHAHNAC